MSETKVFSSQDESDAKAMGDQNSPDARGLFFTKSNTQPQARQMSKPFLAVDDIHCGKHLIDLCQSCQCKRRPFPMTYVINKEDFLSDKYNMNYPKRGFALIINNRDFYSSLKLGTRKGTVVDAVALYSRLQELGFEVERFDNQTVNNMHELLHDMSLQDHNMCDCFFLAILSHGEDEIIYGIDGEIKVADIFRYFKGKQCPSLSGKPKIFLLQACRGQEFDDGADLVVTDAGTDMEVEETLEIKKIPTEADCLILYSVVPGFYSWRNSTAGSWFIQAISKCMRDSDLSTQEFVRVMTKVNRMVAYDFESNTSDPRMRAKKQIPCITSMLTKDLFFPPKN